MPEEPEQQGVQEKKDAPVKKRPAKKSNKKLQPKQEAPKRVKQGWMLKSFAVRQEHVDKLQAIAYKERKTIKLVLDDALNSYLKGKKISPVLLKRG